MNGDRTLTSIERLSTYFRQSAVHPHVAVGDMSRVDLSLFQPTTFGFYCILYLDHRFGNIVKDGASITYDNGTIIWLRPGQTLSVGLDFSARPRGWMLAFRQETLEKTGLGRDFYLFDFFNHDVREALSLSPSERGVFLNCLANLQAELLTSHDYLSDHMIRLGIGQLLSYCKRFFDRQYKHSRPYAIGLRERLDRILDQYLSSGSSSQHGQPTVAWCASQFQLSPNYFGDLVKRELHITAQEYIQQKIVAMAQHLLSDTNMSISEIAEELGFAYPTHFARMFRRRTDLSPQQYRKKTNQSQQQVPPEPAAQEPNASVAVKSGNYCCPVKVEIA